MIDFNYTAPELLPFRIQEVLDAPNEPHRIGGVVYVPEGGGTLTAEDVLNAVYKHGSRWQAIADELNATLGDGECELAETETLRGVTAHVLECSACGETCEHVNGSYPKCPHCGRKAVKR